MSSNVLLSTEGLTRRFGDLTAVDSVTWEVPRGTTKAVIGPNGAGKSTFFNMLSGVLSPTEGTITFDGEDITGHSEDRVARSGLVKTYQQTNIYEDLSVFENVRIAAQARTTTFDAWSRATDLEEVNEAAAEVVERVGLADKREDVAGDLAHGEQRKVEIGIALACDPKAILFDEPIAGMSEDGRHEVLGLLQDLAMDPSLTILVTEHDIDMIIALADEIMVLHQGRILTEGTPEEIVENDQVQEVYLGGEASADD